MYVVTPALPACISKMATVSRRIQTLLIAEDTVTPHESCSLVPTVEEEAAESMSDDSLTLERTSEQEIAALKAELKAFRRHDLTLKAEIQLLRDHRLDNGAAARSIYGDLQDRYERIRTISDTLEEAQKTIDQREATRINVLIVEKWYLEEQEDSDSNSDNNSVCDMEEMMNSGLPDSFDGGTNVKELEIIAEGIRCLRACVP